MLKTRFRADQKIEVGVDEAGRGCLWGSMYAGAVIWPPEEEWTEEYREIAPDIRDSKKLSEKKRRRAFHAIQSLAIDFGVGVVTAAEIDDGGMTFANRLAFERAIEALNVPPERALIDGCLALTDTQMSQLGLEEQETIVEGDAEYLPIAAASILAKEGRDTYVKEWVEKQPALDEKYGIRSSKGYGTAKHRKGILEHGMDAEHRRLFLRKLFGQSCLIKD